MIKVVVSGAAGRLGRRILAELLAAEDVTLEGALVRPGSKDDGAPISTLAPSGRGHPLAVTSDPNVIAAGSVLIEAASKAAALEHLALAVQKKVPALIATTGFLPGEQAQLQAASAAVPLLLAPNLSLGVAVLLDLAARAAAALPGYQLEILELHHAKKKDAPSGTAWALARAAAQARGLDADKEAILARAGETGVRGEREIGMQSIRGGEIVGEHTLYLIGPNERIELSHKASNRDVFAAGALAAARFLGQPGRAPGRYSMRDVLGLA